MNTSNNLEQASGLLSTTKAKPSFEHDLGLKSPSINQELEKMALFVAETWRDDHPTAHISSAPDFQACVLYVTIEMVKAGTAVGGPAGLEILSGGGSAAACTACRQVLSTQVAE